jgi:uncharacterized protein
MSVVSAGRTLRGMIHLPDETEPSRVVCIFPGLDGSKVGPHRMLVHLSEGLEAEGVASVRFDLTGQGDSDGHYGDICMKVHEEDAKNILEAIIRDTRLCYCEIITMGFSYGALIANHIAAKLPTYVSDIIALSPTLNHPVLVRSVLASNPPEAEEYDFKGNVSSRVVKEDILHYPVKEMLQTAPQNILFISGSNDGMVPRQVYEEMIPSLSPDKYKHIVIEGADHSFNHHIWVNMVIRIVCNYVMNRSLLDNVNTNVK